MIAANVTSHLSALYTVVTAEKKDIIELTVTNLVVENMSPPNGQFIAHIVEEKDITCTVKRSKVISYNSSYCPVKERQSQPKRQDNQSDEDDDDDDDDEEPIVVNNYTYNYPRP